MHCLIQKGSELITMASYFTELHIKPPSDKFICPPLSPALVCPPFLDVTDIVDCAINCHVIVVTSHVECTVKFNGPLFKKNITQLPIFGFVIMESPLTNENRPVPQSTFDNVKQSQYSGLCAQGRNQDMVAWYG